MKNDFEVRGSVTAILIRHNGEIIETLIDTDDLEKVINFDGRWHARWDKKAKAYYVAGNIKGQKNKKVQLHRYLTDAHPDMVVDHKNHDTLDNRRSVNIVAVSKQHNAHNSKVSSNSTTGIRGVGFHKRMNKWQARIKVNGKETHLGYFNNIFDAERAAVSAREKYMPYLKELERSGT